MLKIVVVDDHPIVRHGLRSILEREPDITVIAELEAADDLVALYDNIAPDVVLLDLQLRNTTSLSAMRALVVAHPEAKVVIVTNYGDGDSVEQAAAAGARGYVLKADAVACVVDAIRAVHAGGRYSSAALTDLRDELAAARLTRRERDVMRLLAEGATNRVIASLLSIGEETVKNHVKNILDKLQARSRADAVAKAIKRGLLRMR